MQHIFTYIRVSTADQAEKQTYEIQQQAISEFLRDKDVAVLQEFQDLGYSGSDNQRPDLSAMVARLNEVDGIAIYDLDRLSRDFEMGVNLMFLLKNQQKTLYLARTREIQTFTESSDQLLSIIKSWMAEQERQKIKDRQRAGITRFKQKHGRWGRKVKRLDMKKFAFYREELKLSKTACAKLLGLSPNTLYRRLHEGKLAE